MAFTHASWALERTGSYERLEFLGDSVLELAVAHELYTRYPEFSEGRLAKIRSHVVSRQSCAVIARELDLGRRLRERGGDIAPEELDRLIRPTATTPRDALGASAGDLPCMRSADAGQGPLRLFMKDPGRRSLIVARRPGLRP